MGKLTQAYHNLLRTDNIQYSQQQFEVIEELQKFDQKIGYFSKYQGFYLYGEVGRGKSFILDLYFNNSKIKKKKRIHFHEFMNNIHIQIQSLHGEKDPLILIGKRLTKEVKLLFLDELHVHDIGDAMILSRLFTSLFKSKIFIITTSNYHPNELYKHGAQRENFIPAINLLKTKMQIFKIDGKIDYRTTNKLLKRYFINNDNQLEQIFAKHINDIRPYTRSINVNKRIIKIRKTVKQIAWFTFAELCSVPFSAADYQAIVRNFTTIFINDITIINDPNERKRFIILIDELYEHKTKLFCSATSPPEFICNHPEFKRAFSRLIEMCSISQ